MRKRSYDLWTGLDGADEVKYNIFMDYYFENDAPMWEEEWLGALTASLEDIGEQIGVEFGKGMGGYYGNIIEMIVESPDFEPPITVINNGDIYEHYGDELIKEYERYALDIHNAWVEWRDGVSDDWEYYGLLDKAVDAICERADKLAKQIHDDAYDWYVADETASEWLNDEWMKDIYLNDERYKPYLTAAKRRKAMRKRSMFGTVDDVMEHIIYKYDGCRGMVMSAAESYPAGSDERFMIAEIWDYVISIAEDAESLARELGYNGPSVF